MRGQRGGRPLYLSLRPLEDRGDQLVTAVLTDLAEQKATEAALESERLARSIFEQAGEPIIVCDRDGVVIRASRAAVQLIGREPLLQEFDAVLPLRTGDGATSSPSRKRAAGASRQRRSASSARTALRSASSSRPSPLKTADQGLIGSVVTLTDITRLKEAGAGQRGAAPRPRAGEQGMLDHRGPLARRPAADHHRPARALHRQPGGAGDERRRGRRSCWSETVTSQLAAAVPPIGGGREARRRGHRIRRELC